MPVKHKGIFIARARPRRRRRGRSFAFGPPPVDVLSCAGGLAGNYRVEDAATESYLLYRGVDADPDLDSAPWQTFSSFPYTSPDLAGGHIRVSGRRICCSEMHPFEILHGAVPPHLGPAGDARVGRR